MFRDETSDPTTLARLPSYLIVLKRLSLNVEIVLFSIILSLLPQSINQWISFSNVWRERSLLLLFDKGRWIFEVLLSLVIIIAPCSHFGLNTGTKRPSLLTYLSHGKDPLDF